MTDAYTMDEAPDDAAPDAAPSEAKASQPEVNYRAGNPLKNCGLCEHFDGVPGPAPDGCEAVDGAISPFGICDIYLKQQNPFGDQHQYTMSGGEIAPAGPSMPSAPPGLTQIGGKTYGRA